MTYTRVRDCLFLAVGLGGLVYQQVTQTYNAVLVAAYLTLLGFPGLAGVVTLVRSGQSPSSPSQQQLPPPLLPTSASQDGGDPGANDSGRPQAPSE